MTNSMGTDFTDDERKAIDVAFAALKEEGIAEPSGNDVIVKLHQMCKWGRRCTCQHGRNWEQDPDDETVPAYIDALPRDHPKVLEYEETVGRKIAR